MIKKKNPFLSHVFKNSMRFGFGFPCYSRKRVILENNPSLKSNQGPHKSVVS